MLITEEAFLVFWLVTHMIDSDHTGQIIVNIMWLFVNEGDCIGLKRKVFDYCLYINTFI